MRKGKGCQGIKARGTWNGGGGGGGWRAIFPFEKQKFLSKRFPAIGEHDQQSAETGGSEGGRGDVNCWEESAADDSRQSRRAKGGNRSTSFPWRGTRGRNPETSGLETQPVQVSALKRGLNREKKRTYGGLQGHQAGGRFGQGSKRRKDESSLLIWGRGGSWRGRRHGKVRGVNVIHDLLEIVLEDQWGNPQAQQVNNQQNGGEGGGSYFVPSLLVTDTAEGGTRGGKEGERGGVDLSKKNNEEININPPSQIGTAKKNAVLICIKSKVQTRRPT